MRGVRHPYRVFCFVLMALVAAQLTARAAPAAEPTIDELKAKLASTPLGNRPHLCVEIAKRQLDQADKFYAGADPDKAQPLLADVVSFSEQARDYAVQSHKYQKQTEIAVRGMTRKLTDLVHSLPQSDQGPVQDAIKHLQRVRDDLLAAMFPQGAK